MRPITIARNYAEALFELGEKSGQTGLYTDLMDAVAAAVENEPRVQAVMMSPRITKQAKASLLAGALPDAPREFVLFIQAVIRRGRQGLFRLMSDELLGFLDLKFNRVHAGITVAREPDEAMRQAVIDGLSRVLDKEVLPTFRIDPEILGGLVVRVGDRIYDGSVRRRMLTLRRELMK